MRKKMKMLLGKKIMRRKKEKLERLIGPIILRD